MAIGMGYYPAGLGEDWLGFLAWLWWRFARAQPRFKQSETATCDCRFSVNCNWTAKLQCRLLNVPCDWWLPEHWEELLKVLFPCCIAAVSMFFASYNGRRDNAWLGSLRHIFLLMPWRVLLHVCYGLDVPLLHGLVPAATLLLLLHLSGWGILPDTAFGDSMPCPVGQRRQGFAVRCG
ncbi:hypothetical protein Nepgr_006589 [Nepenthes gracilis]|uniref:Uncharacterized protein n=1 Tax=Nepenthes gracilis TaxID=150966 RepID=A0AAD3S5N8_NEPGR|nr:hypothetical protein Nepgr_006589 [Nepenthes gracilis]